MNYDDVKHAVRNAMRDAFSLPSLVDAVDERMGMSEIRIEHPTLGTINVNLFIVAIHGKPTVYLEGCKKAASAYNASWVEE